MIFLVSLSIKKTLPGSGFKFVEVLEYSHRDFLRMNPAGKGPAQPKG
jgi:hypothetical protein